MTEEDKAALAKVRAANREKRLAKQKEAEADYAAELDELMPVAASLVMEDAEEAPLQMPPLGGLRGEPVLVEPEAEPAPTPDAEDPFERFLAAQDAEVRSILSDVELRVIYEADLKKQLEAKREATKKLAVSRATRFNKERLGLTSPEAAAKADWLRKMARKVTFTPEMPRDTNGNPIDVGFRVNGNIIFDGLPHTCTYGEYLSLREQMWRATNHEMDFEGKGRISMQRQLSARALTAKL